MTLRSLFSAVVSLCVAGVFVPAFAMPAAVAVPGTANLFGAGQITLPAPEGNGAGTPPVQVEMPLGVARTFIVTSASGLVIYTPSVAASGPDGVASASYANCDWSGLAGYVLPGIRVLSAVALSDADPVDPAPAKLLMGGLTFTSLAPAVQQIFPVGDGLSGTGTGVTQVFSIPDDATRLFFGFLDSFTGAAPGWYGDNGGQVDITLEWDSQLLGVGDAPARVLHILDQVRDGDGGVRVRFTSGSHEPVTAEVFDVAGRLEHRKALAAGAGEFRWDGRDASGARVGAGVHFVRLAQGGASASGRVALLR